MANELSSKAQVSRFEKQAIQRIPFVFEQIKILSNWKIHMKNRMRWYGLGLLILLTVGIGVYNLPQVRSRLDWRLDELQAKIKYAFSPPEQVIFVPKEQKTGVEVSPSPMADITFVPTTLLAEPTILSMRTSPPAITATPLPAKVQLSGFRHEYQGWNNCGPATLAMALSFWGWKGNQYDIAPVVKPNSRDKNVMPGELEDYVNSQTDLKVVVRLGGELDLLKRLVAAGYPVIIEKGFESPQFDGWMGHYELVTGFDDRAARFTVQDSYMGPNLPISFETMESYWRAFNFTYLVIYPASRETDVYIILGPQVDKKYNDEFAARKASDEISRLAGRDLYFAWFNRGSNLVALQDYANAASAYDQAFALYSFIPKKDRPWRILWYQIGPYQAYYYSGRYQDVIDLATGTLDNMSEPVLEESYYWRALARESLGDINGAMDDLRLSLVYHPGFEPAIFQLKQPVGTVPAP